MFITSEVAAWHSPDFPGEQDIFITVFWNNYISCVSSTALQKLHQLSLFHCITEVPECACIY